MAGLVGTEIEGKPAFTGCIALAIVALFFLVTQVGAVSECLPAVVLRALGLDGWCQCGRLNRGRGGGWQNWQFALGGGRGRATVDTP